MARKKSTPKAPQFPPTLYVKPSTLYGFTTGDKAETFAPNDIVGEYAFVQKWKVVCDVVPTDEE